MCFKCLFCEVIGSYFSIGNLLVVFCWVLVILNLIKVIGELLFNYKISFFEIIVN